MSYPRHRRYVGCALPMNRLRALGLRRLTAGEVNTVAIVCIVLSHMKYGAARPSISSAVSEYLRHIVATI